MIPGDPNLTPSEISSRQNILTSFQVKWAQMWSLECPQGISLIWPSDLIYYPRWPKLKLLQGFIKTNIRTNFQVDRARNVASRAPTRYFFDINDLVYDLRWPEFKVVQDFIQTTIDQILGQLSKKCGLKSVHKVNADDWKWTLDDHKSSSWACSRSWKYHMHDSICRNNSSKFQLSSTKSAGVFYRTNLCLQPHRQMDRQDK